MVVVGSGQLANIFKNSKIENTVVFASGVSDSKCTDNHAFDRETKLLKLYLDKYPNNKFVYFSSCALSAELYERNEYYKHKKTWKT